MKEKNPYENGVDIPDFVESKDSNIDKSLFKIDDEEAQAILKDVQGIGTSATRANVLEVLKKRGYLVTEKNKLHVSEAGITLCKAVELEPLLTSPEMTAKWEKALQQISTEERTPANFLSR